MARFFSVLMVTVFILFQGHATAAGRDDVDATRPPPTEPIYEVVPPQRAGFFWAPGYWGWNGTDYVWHPGRSMRTRAGYVWTNDTWAQRGDNWHQIPGHWELAPTSAIRTASAPIVSAPSDVEPFNNVAAVKPAEEDEEANETATAEETGTADNINVKKKAPRHGGRVHRIVKRPKLNYNDPNQYPFYRHH